MEERKVSFLETVELFDEMVIEKYFKEIDNSRTMLSLAANDGKMHCIVCGSYDNIAELIIRASENNEDLRKIIIKTAAMLYMQRKFDELFGMDNDEDD